MSEIRAARLPFIRWAARGIAWRYRGLRERLENHFGIGNVQWARVVMDRATAAHVHTLDYPAFEALELSGTKWRDFGFGSYTAVAYPAYDVCEAPLSHENFDIVIAEQVLEHVLWPYRAVTNVFAMLRPGGTFVVTTPFLLRIHECPIDCCRWTELGLKQLLAEGGFDLAKIKTGSWGNRACVKGNFRRWSRWVRWRHSLRNEPEFPVVVWAFATK